MTNTIKKMLRIIDKNLTISEVSEQKIKGTQTLIVHAKLSPCMAHCPYCSSSKVPLTGKQAVVKNGTKATMIRFDSYQYLPLAMKLAKQRYFCRSCSRHWTAQSYFVAPHCFIAKQLQIKILALLKEKISLRLIASLCHVSITTVIRVLKTTEAYLPTRKRTYLPSVLMVDEFRSHTSIEDKMSFICADGETGELIDILPSRKLNHLVHYFQKCSNPEKVQFLVTDMNAAYFQLIPRVFPQAKLVVDRFHVVQHLNRAFNAFRIKEVARLRQENKHPLANKLKSNWRFLLKNRAHVNHSTYKTWRSFRAPKFPYLTEAMMIDRLLEFSPALRFTYQVFHELTEAFRRKDHEQFFEQLRTLPEELDEVFRQSITNLLTYEEGIRNAMIYPYSNGKIEAMNTHIKALKRVSYGFKSFQNMKTRIFLMNDLIKMT
ncbi:ISL3 family transposase [Candidatus Enterococcus clewellii]|uniref:Transposase IS204/IS1001/IS1096/IS1165 DDE domain-containing protein n=1 Tax=Candidatus Enterococcus clewellii TaxID=1834193 RepID=A0AAQ3XXS7_9ENTE